MRSFNDHAGRSWTIAINVANAKRVRGLLGVNLYSLVDNGFDGLAKLLSDPINFIDVVYVLCKDDADRLRISDEDFGKGMYGDAIQSAQEAFLSEFADFFPEPRARAGLKRVLELSKMARERVMEVAEKEIAALDLESEVRKLIDSSGIAPESSASIPAHSRSGNSS